MNFISLIEQKRDGHSIPEAQVREMVCEYTAGRIPDYQMAAFLMAVFCRGLDEQETTALTLAMRDSGETLSLPRDTRRPVVDKHSTGGVGDKVSLPLAPLLACLGFRVPMISGRGLGITGGTLDKLDSIPGFQTLLPTDRIYEIVDEVGCVICGQTRNMVPADKGLYALRDVTGTVPSIPLIVASILSKKLAEGLDALLLDVKCGEAAFMQTRERARELAGAMVQLGKACGVRTRALVTAMDVPLGRAAGNWLEINETVEFLSSGGVNTPDLKALVVECAAHLLEEAGLSASLAQGRQKVLELLGTRRPLEKWEAMLAAQGADLDQYQSLLAQKTLAATLAEIQAPRSGFVGRCEARIIGQVVRDLGGGRLVKEASIRPEVGVDHLIKPGAAVQAGAVLCRVHSAINPVPPEILASLRSAFEVTDRPPTAEPLVIEVVV